MGIEKHLSITGTSSVSWKDAVIQAVADARGENTEASESTEETKEETTTEAA